MSEPFSQYSYALCTLFSSIRTSHGLETQRQSRCEDRPCEVLPRTPIMRHRYNGLCGCDRSALSPQPLVIELIV